MLKRITRATLCGFFVAVATSAQPQLWEQVAKITADDAAADDRLGQSLFLSGDTVIVGTYLDDDAGSESGAAYIFERDQGGSDIWSQAAKLTADDAAPGDWFGWSVSVSGDTAIVGALLAGGSSGAAYIFERDQGGPDNWGQAAKITVSAGGLFGGSVSVSDDTAIVGAYLDDDVASNAGAAYIFERDQGGPDNWGQAAKLTAVDAAAGDWFGWSASIDSDTAIVGAFQDDDAGSDSGSAYIFERDHTGPGAWGQVDKLTADDSAAGDLFGNTVSVSDDTAIVGAYLHDDPHSDTGSAYIFERDHGGLDSWGQAAKLTAGDAEAGDRFGWSVSVNRDTVIVGAYYDDAPSTNSGSAYVFERNYGGPGNWGQVERLTADDAAASDFFGISVSLSADTAIVGAYFDDTSSINTGSAYVFRSTGPRLTIPTEIPSPSGVPIDVPVELNTNARDLASLAFSVDYDAACLDFDPTDNDADGIPDAIEILLPATFTAIVFLDLGDTDGELDFVFFANDPTTTNFTDGALATIAFTTTCSSIPTDSIITPVAFSSDPMPSFGDPDAQAVAGTSADGSVEIFSGIRGDCNADGEVSAPDITALQLESFDGDGIFWADTLDVVPYLGSPVGCDANADTQVDAGDLSCKARLIFGQACGGARRATPSDGPRLSVPAELSPEGGIVVAAITFEPRAAAVNSLIFSLDYDESRLFFDIDDLPDAVRFPGAPVTVQLLKFDSDDTDGELDIVVADLSTTGVLSAGVLVEVDLRLLEPSDATIEDGVTFSLEPPASFGDVDGRSVPGTAEVDRGPQVIFADGFESGDTSAWTRNIP